MTEKIISVRCRCKICGKRKTVKIPESIVNYKPGDIVDKEKFAHLTLDERMMCFGHKVCNNCYCIRWGNTESAAAARVRQLDEANQKIKRLKERLKKQLTTK